MTIEDLTRAERRELETLRAVIAQLQRCTDEDCALCASCVTAVFVTARPPEKIPRKYTRTPWAKTEEPHYGREARRWNGR